MKAARFGSYGGVDVIEMERDVALPEPKEGQLLVEVRAASINPFDWKLRAGYLHHMVPVAFPVTAAGDFSGIVAGIGKGVDDTWVGVDVFGTAHVLFGGSGSLAEYVVANAANVAHKPAAVDYGEAASLVLTGISAVQALEDSIALTKGQKILIAGGTGGVGSLAIQYAKHLGATVATTVRQSNFDFAKQLGADVVIDYEHQKVEAVIRDYDAVLDLVGGEAYIAYLKVLRPGGIINSLAVMSDGGLASQYGVRSAFQVAQVTTKSLQHLASLVDSGVIKPKIDKVFTLEETREAFSHLEGKHPKGKVIVSVKGPGGKHSKNA